MRGCFVRPSVRFDSQQVVKSSMYHTYLTHLSILLCFSKSTYRLCSECLLCRTVRNSLTNVLRLPVISFGSLLLAPKNSPFYAYISHSFPPVKLKKLPLEPVVEFPWFWKTGRSTQHFSDFINGPQYLVSECRQIASGKMVITQHLNSIAYIQRCLGTPTNSYQVLPTPTKKERTPTIKPNLNTKIST